MVNFLKKIWDKLLALLLSVPQDKRLHFVAGLVLSAFFCIALDMKFCCWPLIFIAAGKEFVDQWAGGEWDWWDFAATMFGALVPQAFVLLNMWWFPPAG